MFVARCSLLLFLGVVAAGFAVLPPREDVRRPRPADDKWKSHPALAEPDGRSHRGDQMVAADVGDPRVLAELSRRFRQTQPLQLTPQGAVRGAEDFERRQEYLLRLLDYYWFSKPRLVGMTRAEVEAIFGPLGRDTKRADIPAGRDVLHLWFREGRVSGAFYAMGY
jgi:hypothetical protein